MGFGTPSVQTDPELVKQQKTLAAQQEAERKKREQMRISLLKARQQGVPTGGALKGSAQTSETLG